MNEQELINEVEHFENLLHYICKKFIPSTNTNYQDIYSEAKIGLIRGIKTYDNVSNKKTYYYTCIKHKCMGFMAKLNTVNIKFNYSLLSNKYKTDFNNGLSLEDIAKKYNVKRLSTIKKSINKELCIENIMYKDESGNDVYRDLEQLSINYDNETSDMVKYLNILLGDLDDIDYHIIHNYFYLNRNLRQIASDLGVSSAYIHKSVKKILKALRKEF